MFPGGRQTISIGKNATWLVAGISLLLYVRIGYFADRADFLPLFIAYFALFVLYLFLCRSRSSIPVLFFLALMLRVVLLFSIPNLSDDFYRFYWDGLLVLHGINPFDYLPSEVLANPDISVHGLNRELFLHLNSREHYTIYPPVAQMVFAISAFLSRGDVYDGAVIMRVFALMAEAGSLWVMLRLLPLLNLDKRLFVWYAFNPLVILELTGNLHHESFVIFFVLLSVYWLIKHQDIPAAGSFALAVASKLLPLILLPFFLKRLGVKRSIRFYTYTGIFILLLFLPMLSKAFMHGFADSIFLYFEKFEFNASIFYLVRKIGFWVKGWDIIQTAGKWLGFTAFILIILLTIFEHAKKNNVPGIFIWPFFIYLAFSTTVHPWYATPLVAFTVFSRYRFPVVWSLLIFLSYEGYTETGFDENMALVTIEYSILFIWVIVELVREQNLVTFRDPLKGLKNLL